MNAHHASCVAGVVVLIVSENHYHGGAENSSCCQPFAKSQDYRKDDKYTVVGDELGQPKEEN